MERAKSKPTKKVAVSLREQFAARLRELADGRSAKELAEFWGCNQDTAYKYLRGDRLPDIDRWPQIAESLGLNGCRELLPPNI